MPELILPPVCLRFGDGSDRDEEQLRRRLHVNHVAEPLAVTGPEDLTMDLEGLVQRQYRFTSPGLSSVCYKACPGLSLVVDMLSGVRYTSRTHVDIPADPGLAVRIYNAVIRNCFESRLVDHRLIIDPRRKAIEAAVSASYGFLSNYDWLDTCQRFVASLGGDRYRFVSASLSGRNFLLNYVSRQPWFEIRRSAGGADVYYQGLSFSNAETGKAAARAGMLLVDQLGFASRFSLAKQAHTVAFRKDRGRRLFRDLRKKLGELQDPGPVRDSILRMHHQVIGIENLTALRKLAEQLSSALARRRLPAGVVRSVVEDALTPAVSLGLTAFHDHGATGAALEPQSRTYYHLYHALVAGARAAFPAEQERIETLAYDLLMGKFSPLSKVVRRVAPAAGTAS